ncbi:hypothetical protein [Methylicorpusculum sp.]|uniref:hypothetical protein n=1 Tax=Methylicorpusculum sp. TaxID=2713644 RepID=UPI0027214007|nr:hypothetical protein [Methylicorpusculum sp.]MDO8843248.1 hypothetical protein [Methylicorpusculum sp.]
MIDIFTSINLNYLAKARVLANSVKKFHPEARMHLMLSDAIPSWFNLNNEPFDTVITPVDLSLSNAWIFKHSVVELCTAVKPFCFQYILKKYSSKTVFYFDPDTVLFSKIDNLIDMLADNSSLLTPHVCKPELHLDAIVDNEISSLKHGVYNLGFLGVKNDQEGNALIDWWASRLTNFCQDNIPMGIFTDQRWMDFAPVFFPKLKIVREPIYNVATWNYTTRNVTGTIQKGIKVDGMPMCFHHFSGVDNGASVMMLNKYSKDNPTAWELDRWYKDECKKYGQDEASQIPWFYGYYDNGEKVTQTERIFYRNAADLQDEFHDPLATEVPGKKYGVSFYQWLKANQPELPPTLRPFPEFLHETKTALLAYANRSRRLPKYLKKVISFMIRKFFSLAYILSKTK